jgi:hypothetical protein
MGVKVVETTLSKDALMWILAETIESINAAWTVLDVCIVVYFSYYLWSTRKKYKLSWRTIFTWSYGLPIYTQAAMAIFIFHIGDTGVRGGVWLLRHRINEGHALAYEFAAPATVFLAVFATIAGVGLLCKLRVFATPMLGRWVWLAGSVLAASAAVLTHWLP